MRDAGGDEERLARWLAAHVDAMSGPLTITRMGAGQSNVTSVVQDADGREWVLRQPPPGAGPGAHDMDREVRVLRALADGPVPVPAVVAAAGPDEADVDGPCYVMERAPGSAPARESDLAPLSPARRRSVASDVVGILAALHAVDPDEVGLGDLGPREGYLERQIRRTVRNWEVWGEGSVADRTWWECARRLAAAVPVQQRCVIAHGDYRFGNLLVADGRVSAVLDWELCTLGDPLADLAWLADDWRSADEPEIALPSPTRLGGFGTRAEMVAEYARRTGLDVEPLDRYRAFTHWKAATLLQGVLVRRRAGASGERAGPASPDLEHTIQHLLDEALDLVPDR